MALDPDAWSEELLKYIAEQSDGNARVAIQSLRSSAFLAESKDSPRITFEQVKDVQPSVRQLEKSYALGNLSDHHRLLYEVISRQPSIESGDLWRTYLARCEQQHIKPIALRTFSPYINRLIYDGLINAERVSSWTKARRFVVSDKS